MTTPTIHSVVFSSDILALKASQAGKVWLTLRDRVRDGEVEGDFMEFRMIMKGKNVKWEKVIAYTPRKSQTYPILPD